MTELITIKINETTKLEDGSLLIQKYKRHENICIDLSNVVDIHSSLIGAILYLSKYATVDIIGNSYLFNIPQFANVFKRVLFS